MERETRRIWWIVAILIVGIVLLRYAGAIQRAVSPKPVAAHVVLLAEGEEIARAGEHRLVAGAPFRLFAVVEARTLSGSRVVYTEAPRLELDGVEVPPDEIARWPAGRPARVRWLTVEGFAPYLAVADAEDLERFRLLENFHPEWGSGWTVPGFVDPRNVQLPPDSPLRPLPFGTQRYAVRFELLPSAQAVTPDFRVSSAGAERTLAARVGGATSVGAELPGLLGAVSSVFGLTQVDPDPGLAPDLSARLEAWQDAGLVFERARLLARHLEASGRTAAELRWRTVDLAERGLAWGEEAQPGDLLQGGERIVVLFRDEGEAGRLDPEDLCFDFERGAKVRRIDEVYREHGGLELEWASIAPRRSAGAVAAP